MDPTENILILVAVLGVAFIVLAQAYLAGRRDERRGWVKAAAAAKDYR